MCQFINNETMITPLVVIAGRPNVGKSTLFNRLLGKRRSVTHSVSGVTRDPIEEPARIEGLPCRLVDTGGFSLDGDTLQRLVVEKCLTYLETAEVIVLVLEATGLTPEDHDFIEQLRPYSSKVIVAVNKADNPDREAAASEFYATGFERIIPVSALHNRNIDELEEAVRYFLVSQETSKGPPAAGEDEDFSREDTENTITITILGKPNTGKSTLLNTFLSEERAIVSDIPGTTRDVINGVFVCNGRHFKVTDTAGIRRKKKVHEDLEYYSVTRAIESIRKADIVLLMIDAETGLTEQDKKIAAQAEKWGRGIIIVVNKWDLKGKEQNAENAFADRIRFLFPVLSFAPILFISALYKKNVDVLLNQTIQVWKQLHREIRTSSLNKHAQQWRLRNPPPRKNKFQWKVKYITQKRVNPVTFIMFVNRKHGFPAFYVNYIINNIRKDFGLSKIPIRLEIEE